MKYHKYHKTYVDDIGSAGSARTANNTVYNCNMLEERKNLTVNIEEGKSANMLIKGSKTSEEIITEEVKRGRIKNCKEHKSLGTWISEKGGYYINIEKNRKRVPVMIMTVKRIGAVEEVGVMAIQTRLKLMESTMITSLLYNSEAFAIITDNEMKQLEQIQLNIITQLLEMPNYSNSEKISETWDMVQQYHKNISNIWNSRHSPQMLQVLVEEGGKTKN